ncbi:hypothetical protein PACID_31180 [Acidipropionibacterium acidipropionici ATCC 4875]|uniref:Lipoprotein n=1 Tax=Acidipropionibacterium acidipropionici (strain ATCC 4875 / DSM 20272 / JCM 6432 / NBRC 12425 / NCIMB 8070 / 4) TaxID=1171373 RepID=K7S0P0_ACIA4|nr:hypothetical protein [Acidipropionibacterium acidipropionici]AFV90878.1 hypothetical protein PACID_31180 [Acidipropionibacterium acidipropionici ATCC 4875]
MNRIIRRRVMLIATLGSALVLPLSACGLTGSIKDEVTESLREVLRAIAEAIRGIDFPDSATVGLEGYSREDSEVRADASEALGVKGWEPSITQLRAYFHLG